jgi:ferredoxin-NADP reductase
MADRNPRIRNIFSVTRQGSEPWGGHTGRIDAQLINDEEIDLCALFYICGPPEMIQSMLAMLRGLGVAETRIRYEQWW